MLVFIAGASTTGPVKARYRVREEIVGEAVGELGQQVRGGRRHHQHFVLLRDADVLDRTRQDVSSETVRRTCR